LRDFSARPKEDLAGTIEIFYKVQKVNDTPFKKKRAHPF
jgi:hypothetical protein